MKTYFTICIGSMLILLNCSSQNNETKENNKLIGKWIEIRTETEDGNPNDPSGVPFYSDMDLVFYKDSMQYLYSNETGKAKMYLIRQDTLIIDGTKYIIEKISDEELVLLDTDVQSTLGNKRLRGMYKKTE